MRDMYDFAKFFIKNGADSKPNTYDEMLFTKQSKKSCKIKKI